MKLKLLLFFTAVSILGCSSVKNTQESINTGNYDDAIAVSLKKLRENKFKKGNQPYVLLLEEAYAKAAEKDLQRIKFLELEGNASKLEEIYETYNKLNNRQTAIKPLLPLTIVESNRNANFKFLDYSKNIINSKKDLTAYLYANAKTTLHNSSEKTAYRNAYDDLSYLNKITPNYKETNALLEEAHFKGTNFVLVTMQNNSDKIIPQKLEADLLNFNTYKLNDFWTVYHTNKASDLNYNYRLEILLQEIQISPEFVKEKEVIKENKVIDGWKYVKNENGETLKDSTGTAIKVDIYKKVKCKLNVISQTKSTKVIGQVTYFDLSTNQLIRTFPLASEYVFGNDFATYKGDRRALNKNDFSLTNNKYVPFPSNEQMVYDSGEDLKERIRLIIIRNKF